MLFFAHGKRTQRTTEELWPHLFPGLPVPDWWLHYVGKTFRLCKEWPELEASLNFYMERMKIQDYESVARVFGLQLKREKLWESAGVYIRSFHWADSARMFVCRCAESTCYKHGIPRDTVALEQYSGSVYDQRICHPLTHPIAQSQSKYSHQQYQRPETRMGILARHLGGFPSRKWECAAMRSQLNTSLRWAAQDGAATQQESEMPPQVWQHARPSLWKHPDGISSSAKHNPWVRRFSFHRRSLVYQQLLHSKTDPLLGMARIPAIYLQPNIKDNELKALEACTVVSKSHEPDHTRADSGFDMRSMHIIHKQLSKLFEDRAKQEYSEFTKLRGWCGCLYSYTDRYFSIADEDETNTSAVYGSNVHTTGEASCRDSRKQSLPTHAPRQRHTPTLNALEGRDRWHCPRDGGKDDRLEF
ncbi:hypothetical protein J3E73DRAFT_394676 [Bipolaris maydis]|nr:hypothetical protein J3E73DRAFT_394676 [Bipolaris maydis]